MSQLSTACVSPFFKGSRETCRTAQESYCEFCLAQRFGEVDGKGTDYHLIRLAKERAATR